jgi:hypothetical protein
VRLGDVLDRGAMLGGQRLCVVADALALRISAHRGRHFRLIVDGISA